MKHKEFYKVKDHQTFLKVIRFSKLSFSSLYYIGKSQTPKFQLWKFRSVQHCRGSLKLPGKTGRNDIYFSTTVSGIFSVNIATNAQPSTTEQLTSWDRALYDWERVSSSQSLLVLLTAAQVTSYKTFILWRFSRNVLVLCLNSWTNIVIASPTGQ